MLKPNFGGAEQNRTDDPHNAIVVLYQLSYDPTKGEIMQRKPPAVNPLSRCETGLFQAECLPTILGDHALMPGRIPDDFHIGL